MSFSIQKNPNAAKQAAMEAAKARAKGSAKAEDAVLMKYVKPAEVKDRVRIVFDDSGSMSSEIENAKEGVTEFLRNCIPNATAVSIHFLCTNNTELTEKLKNLETDLPSTALALKNADLRLGGTPLFTKLNEVVKMELTTRMVAFTDGSPTDSLVSWDQARLHPSQDNWIMSADVIIAQAVEKKIPIDTIFFGSEREEAREIKLLRYLSEHTGGIFLHFDPKKVNFRTAFKYLAPVNRLALMSPAFRAELEAGKKN